MNIPGYYYDPEKRRYFKVEKNGTAPTAAAWSSSNVKRQKLCDERATTASRHSDLAERRIKRARVLHEPLTGGFFAREYGAAHDAMQAACFAKGLHDMGRISLSREDRRAGDIAQIRCMHVGGYDHKTGMCVAYAAPNDHALVSAYLPRDNAKRLNQRVLANYRLSSPLTSLTFVEASIPHISDIKCHKPSNRMFATSRYPFRGNGRNSKALWTFTVDIDDTNQDPLRPQWLPHSRPVVSLSIRGGDKDSRLHDYQAYTVTAAPASSPLLCAVGTNRGIVQWDRGIDALNWLTPPTPLRSKPNKLLSDRMFRDVFAIEFHPDQSEVLRFGGRPGLLSTADTRAACTSWSYLKLPSAITHLRCLAGGNQVLVAGLENQLGVYDLRFTRSYRGGCDEDDQGQIQTIAQPVIRFEDYHNDAHLDIGFAYDAETGVVAAAQDDPSGTVALYSVRTGSLLRVLDFAVDGGSREANSYHRNGVPGREKFSAPGRVTDRADIPVIRSLQFETFPGDHTSTLFVGSDRHGGITAFSFGAENMQDEA